jgi:hypothetical protein
MLSLQWKKVSSTARAAAALAGKLFAWAFVAAAAALSTD